MALSLAMHRGCVAQRGSSATFFAAVFMLVLAGVPALPSEVEVDGSKALREASLLQTSSAMGVSERTQSLDRGVGGCIEQGDGCATKPALPSSFWLFALEFVIGVVTAKVFLTWFGGRKDEDLKAKGCTGACARQDSKSAVCSSVSAADAPDVTKCLKVGDTADDVDAWGCTALHVAASCGNVSAARELLQRGADVNAREVWDEVPLHFAARSFSAEMCELLLSHGAIVDALNADDHTPLLAAAQSGHEESCRILLAHGAGVGDAADDALPPVLQRLLMERCLEQPSA